MGKRGNSRITRTKSGFIESTGLGYALEKISDPGRGRKDDFSLKLALIHLDVISSEIDRICKWSEKQDCEIEFLAHEARNAIVECRSTLRPLKSQRAAKESAARVSMAYTMLWSGIAAN